MSDTNQLKLSFRLGKKLIISQTVNNEIEILQRSPGQHYTVSEVKQIVAFLSDIVTPEKQEETKIIDVSTQREEIQRKQKQVLDNLAIDTLNRNELKNINKLTKERKHNHV